MSGKALSSAGPVGALIAFALVGSVRDYIFSRFFYAYHISAIQVAFSSLASVGEMTSHAPISGTFPHFASRWVDPAFGFAVGWNYFLSEAIAVASEISAGVIIIGYWFKLTEGQKAGYTTLLILLVITTNVVG